MKKNNPMKTLKDEIREILGKYEKNVRNGETKLGWAVQKHIAVKQLLSAIDKAVRKCVPIELINVNVKDSKTGYKADGFNNCRKQFLDNWEKEAH
jgi:hypothetical protein